MDTWIVYRKTGDTRAVEEVMKQIRYHITNETALSKPLVCVGEDETLDEELVARGLVLYEPPLVDSSSGAGCVKSFLAPDRIVELASTLKKAAGFDDGDETDLIARGELEKILDRFTRQYGDIFNRPIDELLTMLDPQRNEEIYWKYMMMCLAVPHLVSSPSRAQLVIMLEKYMKLDLNNSGKLTREEFNKVPLWFEPDISVVMDPEFQGKTKDLKNAIFDIFSKQEIVVQSQSTNPYDDLGITTTTEKENINDATLQEEQMAWVASYIDILLYMCWSDRDFRGRQKVSSILEVFGQSNAETKSFLRYVDGYDEHLLERVPVYELADKKQSTNDLGLIIKNILKKRKV